MLWKKLDESALGFFLDIPLGFFPFIHQYDNYMELYGTRHLIGLDSHVTG